MLVVQQRLWIGLMTAGWAILSTPALSAETVSKESSAIASVNFSATPAPMTVDEQTRVMTTSVATVRYQDGREARFPLSYETLFLSGDRKGGAAAGQLLDMKGRAVMASAAEPGGGQGVGPFYAYAPDANSLISVGHGAGKRKLYLLTQYEYHTESPVNRPGASADMYGRLPMAVSLATLQQNPRDGLLQATQLRNVDVSSVKGIWIPCAGSLTPWNTHIGGEEYEPNARVFEQEPLEAMNLYLNTPDKLTSEGGANPYDYGHPVEIVVGRDGKTTVHKRLAMGRLSFELVEMMPDERTAYMGDDGRDTMMFMFIADRPRDLSEGTLYAAHWQQTDGHDGGRANLSWIRLGHAAEGQIRRLIDSGIRYSDIFDTATVAEVTAHPEQYEQYRPVTVYEGQSGARSGYAKAHDGPVYLRVKPGMEVAAAFLESRKYGAWRGATSEFTKMEGVTHNAQDKQLYLAMSTIEAGMVAGKNGRRPQDHIRLDDAADLNCGGVYRASLRGGQKDSDGSLIASDWVAADLSGYLMGRRKPIGQTVGVYDRCDTERIANPDNIKYSPAMGTLFIGEDSSNHLNNFLWAHRVDDGTTTRLLSAPIGGELTGLQVVPNANGYAYIMTNIQHPGAANDLKPYPPEIKNELRQRVDQRGRVGYVGGLPAVE
jgi:secreted PhoX family phosphatase